MKDQPTNYIEKINPNEINLVKLHRLAMIQNALDNGWKIEKKNTSYIFSKPHHEQKEIYEERFLNDFLIDALSLSVLQN
jgi:hypothetical protein